MDCRDCDEHTVVGEQHIEVEDEHIVVGEEHTEVGEEHMVDKILGAEEHRVQMGCRIDGDFEVV